MSESNEDSIEIEIEDFGHGFRTEIPNLLRYLGLSPAAKGLYFDLKSIAGDHGDCWRNARSLAEQANMTKPTYRKYRDELAKPRPELGGKSLITVKRRRCDKKGDQTTLITIKDVWPENAKAFQRIKKKLPPFDIPEEKKLPGAEKKSFRGRGKNLSPKKNPLEEEPMSKNLSSKDNDSQARSLPSVEEKKGTGKTKSRFPVSKEQRPALEALLELGIDFDDPDLPLILVRKHYKEDPQHFYHCLANFKADLQSGKKMHSPIQYLRNMLNKKQKVNNSKELSFKEYAEMYIAMHNLPFNITKNGVNAGNLGEISFACATQEELHRQLETLVNRAKLYG